MALNSRLKALAERVLPQQVLVWLDPVQHLIETEVQRVAQQLQAHQIVLDAGAGEARHRSWFKRGRYIALDAGYGDAAWNYSGLDIRGDLERIPLRSESVDCILCMVVLEHTKNPKQVLLEFARVLKMGGSLVMVVPFLWEEHQAPHDFFRFTRHGVRALLESLPLQIDCIQPLGGFFWVCARRSVGLLTFFQGGWRWIAFALLAPFFGLLFPIVFYFLDGLDKAQNYSLGFRIRATKKVVSILAGE
jgi:SAM-dependent methyltransferase